MVDSGIFATTAEIGYKAGYGKSATSAAEAYTNSFIAQAESRINVDTEYNWSDVYSTLNVDVKGILKEAASNLAAVYVINYDMSGYSSKAEAQSMIDVLMFNYNECIKILRDKNKGAIFLKEA
jgi:hypothetical protein